MNPSDRILLATLCPLCTEIFAKPRKRNARYDMGQTYVELEISAKSKSCQLCYLRWMQRMDVDDERPNQNERQRSWANLQYYFSISPESSKVFFSYADAITGKKEVDQFVVLQMTEFPGYSMEDGIPQCNSGPLSEGSDTGSPEALAFAYSWFQECTQTHEACKYVTADSEPQPTRLIYLGDGPELEPRLVETSTLSERPQYCTLSHSWGEYRITCLTRDNFAQFKVGVPPDAISKSFHDAMLVAKSLGIMYIWIDSLCIIQKDLSDWVHESLHMSHVYRNALCNIGATSAKDGSVGCFAERSEIDIRPCWVNFLSPGVSTPEPRFIADFRFWRRHVLQSPLGRRGWIVQERHLARRMIHFARSQIYWECREQTASENFPRGLPEEFMTQFMLKGTNEELHASLDAISSSTALKLWTRFVRDYSSRNLTEERDKLVAISGLAKVLAPHINSRYLAGLWESDLPSMILWRIETPLHTADPAMTAKRLETYQAPSWSWASLRGGVILPTDKPNDRIFVSILQVQANPVGHDEFGQIRSGFLKISGYLAKAGVFVPYKNDVPNRTAYLVRDQCLDPKGSQNFLANLSSCNISEVVAGQLVYCMPVMGLGTAISGLVLQPSRRDPESNVCVFRRLGLFNCSHDSSDQSPGTPVTTHLGSFEVPCRNFVNQQDSEDFQMQSTEYDSEGIPRFNFIIE